MRSKSRLTLLFAIMLLLGGLITWGANSSLAQEATPTAGEPSRPAHVHTGTCAEIGDIVGPLNNLEAPAGTPAGSTEISVVQYSFTSSVPVSLDTILASEHAVNLHESDANIQEYIACGNVGGVVDANGTLVIGLREQNNSGYSGIAVLTTSATDPATTDVSVFIGEGLSGAGEE